jgi:hypothetical protein
MATVRLRRFEVDEGLLPPVCLRCGAKATLRRTKKFTRHPLWVLVFVVLGLGLPGIVVATIVGLVLARHVTILTPLCDEHRNHFALQSWSFYGGFGMLAFGVALATALMTLTDASPGRNGQLVFGMVCGGGGLVALAWWIGALVVRGLGIRVTEITDRSITLTNVSEDFVDAMEVHRHHLRMQEKTAEHWTPQELTTRGRDEASREEHQALQPRSRPPHDEDD